MHIDQTWKCNDMKNNTRIVLRVIIYAIGMAILALGIVLNTKSKIGMAPILSFPFFLNAHYGEQIGNVMGMTFFSFLTFIWYCLFVIIQLIIGNKGGRIKILLQVPISYAFTALMSIYQKHIIIVPANVWQGIVVALVAAVFTGLGIALCVSMRMVPNPGDGMVQSLSDCLHIKVGKMKNIFDSCLGGLTIVVGIIMVLCGKYNLRESLGGIIGWGTLIAIVMTGIFVSFWNKLFVRKMMGVIYTKEQFEKYASDT